MSTLNSNNLECDACVRLPLRQGEYLTVLTPLRNGSAKGGGGDDATSTTTTTAASANTAGGGGESTVATTEWMLAGTSQGRIWKMTKTTRPLGLHAKLVNGGRDAASVSFSNHHYLSPGMEEGDGEEEGEEYQSGGGGIVRGLYNYIFTPSKKSRVVSAINDVGAGDSVGSGMGTPTGEVTAGGGNDCGEIVALIPLPSTATINMDGKPNSATSSATATTSPSQPSPMKKARINAPPSTLPSSNHAKILSITNNLTLREYNLSTTIHSESLPSHRREKEGSTFQKELLVRNDNDGTFTNLGTLLGSDNGNNDSMQQELQGYRNVDLIASPSLTRDGQSLIMAIRLGGKGGSTVDRYYGGNGAPGVDASTRVYLIKMSLSDYTIVDVAWLDRYSGESLSRIGGSLECAGLVVGEDDSSSSDGNGGGAVAYIAFGPKSRGVDGDESEGAFPVTVSAVQFSPFGKNDGIPPRIKDLDLFPHTVPSVIEKSMSYDSTTGGCLFLSSVGLICGTHVRFPPMDGGATASSSSTATPATVLDDLSKTNLEALSQDDAVLTIKSHLQSAFRQYLGRIRDGGSNLAFVARSVAPPSLHSCSSTVLSAAVVLTSTSICNGHAAKTGGNAGGGTMSSPSFAFQKTGSAPNSSMAALRDKLKLHSDFVKFLLHAGAYRKVSFVGRMKLRDHGEMIMAARATLVECQRCLTKMEGGAADEAQKEEMAMVRRAVMGALAGTSEVVTDLAYRWAGLQELLGGAPNKDMVLLVSSAVCAGIGSALKYREDESSILYDIPSHDSSSRRKGAAPWTSLRDVLVVLQTNLQYVQAFGEAILSSSMNYDEDKTSLRTFVEDMSLSLLEGYSDIVLRETQNEEVVRSYEEAKVLAIPLIRHYVNDDGDDLEALDMSLKHSFFEGIVQICHDHRSSWRFRGPFSPVASDETYDIRLMLSGTQPDSQYSHLHQTKDFRTGLPFCDYVLHWYADRGSRSEVLELGKECPHVLTRFLRNDNRLVDLAWVHDLRTGANDQATAGLLNLTSSTLPGSSVGGTSMGLWEKEQMMSIAKLSNKLARSRSPNSVAANERVTSINDILNIIEAQRILQEDDLDEDGSEVAMPADELLVLAVNKIKSARDVDEVKKFGICGLAIAHAMGAGDPNAMINSAATIWEACIHVNIHLWNNVARENSMMPTGHSDEELMRRIEGTAFGGVIYHFSTTSSGSMNGVGFLSNGHVRSRVFESLGSDEELAQCLIRSAELFSG